MRNPMSLIFLVALSLGHSMSSATSEIQAAAAVGCEQDMAPQSLYQLSSDQTKMITSEVSRFALNLKPGQVGSVDSLVQAKAVGSYVQVDFLVSFNADVNSRIQVRAVYDPKTNKVIQKLVDPEDPTIGEPKLFQDFDLGGDTHSVIILYNSEFRSVWKASLDAIRYLSGDAPGRQIVKVINVKPETLSDADKNARNQVEQRQICVYLRFRVDGRYLDVVAFYDRASNRVTRVVGPNLEGKVVSIWSR